MSNGSPVTFQVLAESIRQSQGNVENIKKYLSNLESKEVVQLCNQREGDANQSILHVAASFGHQNIVQYLLECKSNANYRDNSGCTPLMHAIRSGSLPSCEALLTLPKYIDVSSGDIVINHFIFNSFFIIFG